MIVEHSGARRFTDLAASTRVVEQLREWCRKVVGGDEVLAVHQRLETSRRLGQHRTSVCHRLDHSRPFEVARRGVVAVEVEEDPAARQQAVFVVAEHRARRGAVDRGAETEESQLDIAIPEHGSERRQRRRPTRRRAAEEQQVEVAFGRRRTHRRHATELQVHRLVPAGANRIHTLRVDVDHQRGVADQAGGEVEPGCAGLLGAHRDARCRGRVRSRRRSRRRARTARAARRRG